jgi:hypothetical protein
MNDLQATIVQKKKKFIAAPSVSHEKKFLRALQMQLSQRL